MPLDPRSCGSDGWYDGMTPQRREFWIGIGCAAAILSIWTGFILISRFGARTSFNPPDLLALRVGIAGLVMAPLLWRDGFGGLSFYRRSPWPCSPGSASPGSPSPPSHWRPPRMPPP